MSLRERAQKSLAQFTGTNSKRPSNFVDGVYPTHVSHGYGPYLIDSDNKRYVDFIGALGTSILGYGFDPWKREVYRELNRGILYSLPSYLEVVCAEKIKSMFPFIEKMKFLKTGAEGCSAAVRIARAYHQKKRNNEKM